MVYIFDYREHSDYHEKQLQCHKHHLKFERMLFLLFLAHEPRLFPHSPWFDAIAPCIALTLPGFGAIPPCLDLILSAPHKAYCKTKA